MKFSSFEITKSSITLSAEKTFIQAGGASEDDDDTYFKPNDAKMCPVVSMDLVPDGSLMKIKPVFKTFVPEEPILIEVYSEKGVTFGEFYVQAKDAHTNSTVGHWRIDDERQSAYKCSG